MIWVEYVDSSLHIDFIPDTIEDMTVVLYKEIPRLSLNSNECKLWSDDTFLNYDLQDFTLNSIYSLCKDNSILNKKERIELLKWYLIAKNVCGWKNEDKLEIDIENKNIWCNDHCTIIKKKL